MTRKFHNATQVHHEKNSWAFWTLLLCSSLSMKVIKEVLWKKPQNDVGHSAGLVLWQLPIRRGWERLQGFQDEFLDVAKRRIV